MYYSLSVYNKPSWGRIVTIVQMLQMVCGLLLAIHAGIYGCEPIVSLIGAGTLYSVYLYLFFEFFTKKTSKKTSKKISKKEE